MVGRSGEQGEAPYVGCAQRWSLSEKWSALFEGSEVEVGLVLNAGRYLRNGRPTVYVGKEFPKMCSTLVAI